MLELKVPRSNHEGYPNAQSANVTIQLHDRRKINTKEYKNAINDIEMSIFSWQNVLVHYPRDQLPGSGS